MHIQFHSCVIVFTRQDMMDVEWRWTSRSANDRSNRLAQLGTEVFLNDPAAPSHRVEAIKRTLEKARRAGWRLCPLINQTRVAVGGVKRIQVKCSVPKDDDGKLKTVSAVISLLCEFMLARYLPSGLWMGGGHYGGSRSAKTLPPPLSPCYVCQVYCLSSLDAYGLVKVNAFTLVFFARFTVFQAWTRMGW